MPNTQPSAFSTKWVPGQEPPSGFFRTATPFEPPTSYPANIKLYTGQSHPDLARKVAAHLNLPICEAKCGKFANGESFVDISQSCRGVDAFVIQAMNPNPESKLTMNDSIMELLIFISALRSGSAQRITVVVPYYAYARQDKKEKSRVAIVARLLANLLEVSGIDHVITMELHADQIMGFFSKPIDNLHAERLLRAHIAHTFEDEDVVVVTPHASGFKRAARIAEKLLRRGSVESASMAVLNKVQLGIDQKVAFSLVGEVKDKVAILVDDMVDRAKNIVAAAYHLQKEGARCTVAYMTHGVLSKGSLERINACKPLAYVVVTNTLPQHVNLAKSPKLVVVDASAVIADGIKRSHQHLNTGPNTSTSGQSP